MTPMADGDLERITVSVVVPFWNRIGDTVAALASIQQQTHANLEVFFVDDGSTEDLTPLLELCAKDSRVRVVHQAHQGAAVARNHGVSLASGTYVALLDSDDLFDPPRSGPSCGSWNRPGPCSATPRTVARSSRGIAPTRD